jgi:pSer/pThr/pTyr-binding forkhead associated (FHA) protein
MRAYLRLAKAAGPIVEVPVENSLEIGRADAGWDLVARAEGRQTPLGVQDAMASRRHACVYFEDERLMVRDLGSLNGTTVNDRALPDWAKRRASAAAPLTDGSVIKIGNTEIEVRMDAAPSYDKLLRLVREVKLESELSQRHPSQEARRLANCFRIILDISENCCNTRTTVRELQGKLDMLKQHLAGDALAAGVNDLQRRIGAELYQEEFLHEPQVCQVRDFSRSFVEQWSSRFM